MRLEEYLHWTLVDSYCLCGLRNGLDSTAVACRRLSSYFSVINCRLLTFSFTHNTQLTRKISYKNETDARINRTIRARQYARYIIHHLKTIITVRNRSRGKKFETGNYNIKHPAWKNCCNSGYSHSSQMAVSSLNLSCSHFTSIHRHFVPSKIEYNCGVQNWGYKQRYK